MMSGRFRNALSKVPKTKPSCTAMVNQLTSAPVNFHSVCSEGTTAAALNHSDMPNNSARDNKKRARHRADGSAPLIAVSVDTWSRSMRPQRILQLSYCGGGFRSWLTPDSVCLATLVLVH